MSGRNKLLEERNLFAHGFGGILIRHSGEAWQRDLVTMAEAYSHFAGVQGIHAATNGRNNFKRPTASPILVASPDYNK